MLKRCPSLFLAALLLVLLTACQGRTGGLGPEVPLLSGTLAWDGLSRSYYLLVPASYDSGQPAPLVLALHGGGGDADRMCRLPAGINELAEAEGFLVACPQGVEQHWNDGRTTDRYRAHRESIDDVGFLLALIDELAADYAVDSDRVYATGMSNGGMMSYRLACEASDRLAGVAAVIANLPVDLDCAPSSPIPVLIMNGTEDPLMPHHGGQVSFFRQELGGVLSTEQTAHFWAQANGCDGAPPSVLLPEQAPNDGTRIRRQIYTDCDPGGRLLVYLVEGGGHTWPGGSQYAGRNVIGRVSREGHAGQAIWAFFEGS